MKISIYIGILVAFVCAQPGEPYNPEDNFDISINVEYMGIQLRTLDGLTYTSYITDTLFPGDTTVCDSVDGIWLDNQSNIPVGFIARAYDDSVFLPSDSMAWVLSTRSGIDTCALGIVLYAISRSPNMSGVQWLRPNPAVIYSGLGPGEDRFGYIYLIAPNDTIAYGEPRHRLKIIIGVYPE